MLSDISKAYYQMLTGELEFHVRRVIWRYGDASKKLRVFGFKTASMGDRPAACLLEIVAKLTVELFGHLDPVAGERILRDRYVDDVSTGGSNEEVKRFVGKESEDYQCSVMGPYLKYCERQDSS